jgi:anti-sigma regulatory factor (Ser/Thr protein kinase)
MASAATQANPRLIALTLPSIPGSGPVARLQVRAALGLRGLGEYADDAEIITSELVTNAIQHGCGDGMDTAGVTFARTWNPEAVTVIVTDSTPRTTRVTPGLSSGWPPTGTRSALACELVRQLEAAGG